MLDKSFTLEDKHKRLQCTYLQPRLVLTIKSENQTTSMTYTTDNLPVSIKEDCQSVFNLFEYLSENSEDKIELREKEVKFKTVGIKKEKWFSLPVTEKSRDQSYLLNRIRFLEAQNAKLKQSKDNHSKMIPQQVEEEIKFDLGMLNQEKFKQNLIKLTQKRKIPEKLHLTVNIFSPGFKKVFIQDNLIEKKTDKTSCMLYCNEEINRDRQVFFKVKIIKFIGWLMIGVLAENNLTKEFAYCQLGCMCFSVSMKTIFVETQGIGVDVNAKENDIITVQVSIPEKKIQWMINDKTILVTQIPSKMMQHRLYPYLELSKKGDQVQLNDE